MRGPGQTRRFGGFEYQLAKRYAPTFNEDGSVNVPSYEERNAQAKQRAAYLRAAGIRARVVNGSGWTAVYVNDEMATMPQPQSVKIMEKALEETPLEIPSGNGKLRQAASNVAKLGKMQWGPILGVDGKQPMTPPPVEQESADMNEMRAISGLMQTYGEDFEGKTGMAKIGDKKTNPMLITDARIVKGDELVEILMSIPSPTAKNTFQRWLVATKSAGDKQYQQNPAKKDMMQKLAYVLLGNKKATKENLEGVELYMVFEDVHPVFWQFSDGTVSSRMMKRRKENAPPTFEEVKTGEIRKGWSKFKAPAGFFTE